MLPIGYIYHVSDMTSLLNTSHIEWRFVMLINVYRIHERYYDQVIKNDLSRFRNAIEISSLLMSWCKNPKAQPRSQGSFLSNDTPVNDIRAFKQHLYHVCSSRFSGIIDKKRTTNWMTECKSSILLWTSRILVSTGRIYSGPNQRRTFLWYWIQKMIDSN